MTSYRRVQTENNELLCTVWSLVTVRNQLPAQVVKQFLSDVSASRNAASPLRNDNAEREAHTGREGCISIDPSLSSAGFVDQHYRTLCIQGRATIPSTKGYAERMSLNDDRFLLQSKSFANPCLFAHDLRIPSRSNFHRRRK